MLTWDSAYLEAEGATTGEPRLPVLTHPTLALREVQMCENTHFQ